MNDLERVYFNAAFASAYPEFAEAEREEQKKLAAPAAPKPKQPAMTAGDAGAVTLDTLASLLRGATAATLGLPGDLESLVRMLTGGEQKLLTTEDVAGAMPPVIPEGAQVDARRRSGVPGMQSVGEFLPVAPIALTKSVVKAIRKGVTK